MHETPENRKQLPAFERRGPAVPSSPIVLSVPHAGRAYSQAILDAARLTLIQLESLEDRLMDRLIEPAQATGAVAIVAQTPRAEIDLNRDEREVDPAIIAPPPPARSVLPSARTRGGLGLIPARITGAGPIWQRPIQSEELSRRIIEVHRPYHRALTDALQQARSRFGVAILIDCHSMPPRAESPSMQADVVFGDLHGTSIASELRDTAIEAAQDLGFRTTCNAPYAGGYITARHGRPAAGVHAIQIEIDRSLYLADDLRSPGPGFARTAAMLAEVTRALAAKAAEPPQAIAAE
jgi:N-formylglutamate amidohydrolase